MPNMESTTSAASATEEQNNNDLQQPEVSTCTPNLLTIPQELRDQIFDEALHIGSPLQVSALDASAEDKARARMRTYTALVRTCRQLFAEVEPRFWPKTAVIYSTGTLLTKPLPASAYPLVRRLVLFQQERQDRGRDRLVRCIVNVVPLAGKGNEKRAVELEIQAWRANRGETFSADAVLQSDGVLAEKAKRDRWLLWQWRKLLVPVLERLLHGEGVLSREIVREIAEAIESHVDPSAAPKSAPVVRFGFAAKGGDK
jgi:hypothetical protein